MSDTRQRILDSARTLVQKRGFNGFSYHDISAEVGVKTATIHYYFRSKEDLGNALIDEYIERFQASLRDIETRHGSARDRLLAYAALFREVLASERYCVCGILGSEAGGLPPSISRGVSRFFEYNSEWLRQNLMRGAERHEFKHVGNPLIRALMFIAMLEGCLIMTMGKTRLAHFDAMVTRFLDDITG